MCTVFSTDLVTQLGFAHGILYLPVLIYAMILSGTSHRFHQAVLASAVVGTVLGFFLAPRASDLPMMYLVTNRLLSVGILVLSYAYCCKLRTLSQQYQDISDLEQSQRQTFEDIIDALPVQVWSADANGEVDSVSNHLARFSGRPRDAIPAQWLDLLHPDDRKRTVEAWTRSVQTGQPYQVDFRMQRHDGEYVWFKTQAVAQKNAYGQIKRWLGSSVDIDDLRRFREKSERLAAKFRHTVESITDAFFTLDHDFRFTYLNQKCAEILCSTVDSLLGEVIWEKCPIGYQSPFAINYRDAASSGQTLHFEEFFPPGDKWLEVHVYPSPDGITVYFADITLQKKMQAQLLVTQKMESIGQLTGGISHDFNNLLTVILGNAELLQQTLQNEGQEDLAELADIICQASEKGATLTKNLLAFAKKQPLSPRRVQIADLLDEMTPLLKTSLGERNQLEVAIEKDLWAVVIDPSQLESALLNLAINARDAMSQGGCVQIHAKNCRVDASLQVPRLNLKPGPYVQLAFSDNGDGMPNEVQERVFEPFFTTKGDSNGSGLGLSMIYGFLRQSGGDITVYSEPGLGATFNLYLPCEGEHTDPETETEAEHSYQAASDGSVLVVEDNADIRSLAVSALRSAGYSVTEAENGEHGLRLILAGYAPDLLFTDVVMPGTISGPDLARQAQEQLPGLKAILTSGFKDLRSDISLQQLYSVLLPKPYRCNELLELVHRQLTQKALPSGENDDIRHSSG